VGSCEHMIGADQRSAAAAIMVDLNNHRIAEGERGVLTAGADDRGSLRTHVEPR